MDSISNPWWLGGNICAGVPFGAEIASKLGARVWISAHDGEKDVRGFATGMLKTRRWRDEEIEGALESRLGNTADDYRKKIQCGVPERKAGNAGGTEIVRLNCGEEILVSGTGRLWRNAINQDVDNQPPVVDLAVTSPASPSAPAKPTLVKEPDSPPAPTIQTPVKAAKKHQGKYYHKTPEAPALPKVRDGMMSPKKPSVYMSFRTKDLIKPSPKLTLEADAPAPPLVVVHGPADDHNVERDEDLAASRTAFST